MCKLQCPVLRLSSAGILEMALAVVICTTSISCAADRSRTGSETRGSQSTSTADTDIDPDPHKVVAKYGSFVYGKTTDLMSDTTLAEDFGVYGQHEEIKDSEPDASISGSCDGGRLEIAFYGERVPGSAPDSGTYRLRLRFGLDEPVVLSWPVREAWLSYDISIPDSAQSWFIGRAQATGTVIFRFEDTVSKRSATYRIPVDGMESAVARMSCSRKPRK
jgi:hypothetical protein